MKKQELPMPSVNAKVQNKFNNYPLKNVNIVAFSEVSKPRDLQNLKMRVGFRWELPPKSWLKRQIRP